MNVDICPDDSSIPNIESDETLEKVKHIKQVNGLSRKESANK